MSLALIGLSHKSCPVEVRERIAFTAPGTLERALDHLKSVLAPTGSECVLLSTCNRTELYVATPEGLELSTEDLVTLLVEARGDDTEHLLPPYLEERRGGHRVTEHLFRVASGLESMVLGENDIVRQVKEAYANASDHALCGPVLNPLFHESLRVAKRARTEFEMQKGAFSVGHAAAQLAENIFGSLQGHTVLLLGAGAMSETTARHLAAAGASSVLVANRTFDRAARLAESLNGRAIQYDEFAAHLARTDIVIASTAAPHFVVTKEMVAGVLRERRHRPLFLIDIAVPRDIEASVGDLPDVFLYNIDDLQAVVDGDLSERRRRAARAEAVVHEEAVAFAARQRATQTVAPLVSSLRAKQRAIVEDELARLRRRLAHLPDADWAAIEAFARSVENKTLHDPTLKVKEYAAPAPGEEAEAEAKIATVREIFGLEAGRATSASDRENTS